jgi:hypothetical protein
MAYEEVRYRWTAEDWANAAAARKAKEAGAAPLPKVLLTPYGLSAFELHTDRVEGGKVVPGARVHLAGDDAKKPLFAWDIAIGAEVMLPLELAKFGEPWQRDRFFKKGQEWVPLPASAGGPTLLELCRSLYETGEPRFDVYHFFAAKKTDPAWQAGAVVRERIVSKLVGHWKNTEYHYEQKRQGLALNEDLPVRLGDATLAVVLAEPPPKPLPKPVVAQGPSGGASAGNVITVGASAPESSPPPPPFDRLPEPLKLTLLRSYRDRKDGVPGAERSLVHAFDKGANVWEALNKGMSWQDVNSMVRVYQRIETMDRTGALWRDHIRYVIRAYTYGIYAVEFVFADRRKLRDYLDTITRRNEERKLAREWVLWQCMHWGTVGWREVSQTDQLHISVADDEHPDAVEDIHIDETSFTNDRDGDGSTKSAVLSGPTHFAQSQLKWIEIARPFSRLEEISRASERDRPPMTPDTLAAFEDWCTKRGSEAVSGETGHRNANELLRRILRDFSGSPPGPPSRAREMD